MSSTGTPALHVVLRTTARENAKPRPAWYDKGLCLQSLVRAAQEVDGDLVFLNVQDGPLPPERVALMASVGRVVEVPAVSMGHTYARGIRLVDELGWRDDDLVYLAEDDYLLDPDALAHVVRAAVELPHAQYFALYGVVSQAPPNGQPLPTELRVPPTLSGPPRVVDGTAWHPAVASNLSVVVRIGALRRDRWLHLIAPRAGAWFDHFLSLALQGEPPVTLRQMLPLQESPRLSRRVAIAGWRAALTAGALARRHRRHHLVAAVPPLACHAEEGYLGAGRDWAALAADTVRWAQDQGLQAGGRP